MTTETEKLAILDQIHCDGNRFDADKLPQDLIAALKYLEMRNRNFGAVGRRTEDWVAYRGAFRLRAEARTYLHYLAPETSHVVMEAGAGMGRLAMVVAPKVSRLVCVDFAERALEVLREGARARGIRNIVTIASDLCALPDSLGPFDSAYAVEVIEQIPSYRERLRAMQNLRDVLKPGGTCLVSVYPWNRRTREDTTVKEGFYGVGQRKLYRFRFTSSELRALFEEAGFRETRIRGLIAIPSAITGHFPPTFAALETWCSHFPVLSQYSWLLFGTGVR